MSQGLAAIHARLQAADRALALARGGSSELARLREATGSLLVALHELVALWEEHLLAPGGLGPDGQPPASAVPTARKRRARK